MRKYLNLRPNIALGLTFAFLVNTFGPVPIAQADEFRLPAPGVRVGLSPEYNPAILKGLKVHSDNPFRFDFILDQGDSVAGKAEAIRLIKYFLASLTIPEKDLWVNLSPYEKNRIVPESFGRTEMGRDLLAEDYMLKQITASLIYPEDETGKRFWKRIYQEAAKKFGTTNIPVNTFNKVWIVPEKAVVYENAKAGTAYVVESKLKVMLEQDYLALKKNQRQPGDMFMTEQQRTCPQAGCQASKALNVKASQVNNGSTNESVNALGSQIVREIVIPELTKEINENKNFAQLRQVYNSLILATWYKKKIKDSILAQVYADKNKIQGLVIPAKAGIQKNNVEYIYQQYLQAFKKGSYNYIKEETDPITQQTIPRKYFSGGVTCINLDEAMTTVNSPGRLPDAAMEVSVNVKPDFAMNVKKEIDEQRFQRVVNKLNEILGPENILNEKIIDRIRQFINSPFENFVDLKMAREIAGDVDKGSLRGEDLIFYFNHDEIIECLQDIFMTAKRMYSQEDSLDETVESTRKPIILTVDDDPTERIKLYWHLSEAGYFVISVHSAEEGLEVLEKYHKEIALVVTDFTMFPDMNGMQFIERMMEKEQFNKPVFMRTGDLDNAKKAMENIKGGQTPSFFQGFSDKRERIEKFTAEILQKFPVDKAQIKIESDLGRYLAERNHPRDVEKALRLINDKSCPLILEIGAGEAEAAFALAQKGFNVVAIDLYDKYSSYYDYAYDFESRLLPGQNYNPHLAIVRASGNEILGLLPEGVLDAVIMIHPDNPTTERLFQWLSLRNGSKLKKGGKIIIKPFFVVNFKECLTRVPFVFTPVLDGGEETFHLNLEGLSRHHPIESSRPQSSDVYVWKKPDAAMNSPVKKPRLLVLDDRQSHLDRIKEVFGSQYEITTAMTLQEAESVVNDQDRFDLVISDLDISRTIWTKLSRVDFQGKKVLLVKGGLAFVNWLNTHPKRPQHIILHSTMFEPSGSDRISGILVGNRPKRIKRSMYRANVLIQPKSQTFAGNLRPEISAYPDYQDIFQMWMADMVNALKKDSHPIFVITGNSGAGKTIMSELFKQFLKEQEHPLPAVVIHTDRLSYKLDFQFRKLAANPFIPFVWKRMDHDQQKQLLDQFFINRERADGFWEQIKSLRTISPDQEVNLSIPGYGNIAIRPGAIIILEGGLIPRMFPGIDVTKSVFVRVDQPLAKERVFGRTKRKGYSNLMAKLDSMLAVSPTGHRWLDEGLDRYDYIIEVAADETFNMLIQNQDQAMGTTDQAKPRNLFVIGMDHLSDHDNNFQRDLVRQASQGKIVLGLEGVVRDDKAEQEFVKDKYGVDKGLVFGYEDDFAYQYVGILMNYGRLANGISERSQLVKLVLIADIRRSQSIFNAWKSLETKVLSESTKSLYDRVNVFVRQNQNLDTKEFFQKLYESRDQFDADHDWIELYKELAIVMTESAKNLPPDLRPDINQIQAFLRNPTDVTEYAAMVNKVNEEWRERFLILHMREISDIAVQKGLDAYILIGSGHGSNIIIIRLSGVDGNYRGMVIRSYASTHLVPEQHIPKDDRAMNTDFKKGGKIGDSAQSAQRGTADRAMAGIQKGFQGETFSIFDRNSPDALFSSKDGIAIKIATPNITWVRRNSRDNFLVMGWEELRTHVYSVSSLLQNNAQEDLAMSSKQGGIDLTPANMHLQTKMDSRVRGNDSREGGNDRGNNGNDNGGIKFHIDPAMLEQLQNAPGFVPVIISVQPMRDLRRFLGIASLAMTHGE